MAEILLSCIAGCAGVSGRGYYVKGPVLDVLGRPRRGEAVLLRPAGMSEMPKERLRALLSAESCSASFGKPCSST